MEKKNKKTQNKRKSKPTDELLTTFYLYNTFGVGERKLIVTQVTIDFWYRAGHRDWSGVMGPARLLPAYEILESQQQGKRQSLAGDTSTDIEQCAEGWPEVELLSLKFSPPARTETPSPVGASAPSASPWCGPGESAPWLRECVPRSAVVTPLWISLWQSGDGGVWLRPNLKKKMKSVAKTQL